MKLKHGHQHMLGLTLIEVLVIIVMVAVLIGLIYTPSGNSSRSRQINCINNLKHVGGAFLIWANDHEGKFPFQVSTNQGGSLEYFESKDVYRHVQMMTNEISNFKAFWCPADQERSGTASFENLSNQNLSYFLALNALRTNASGVLAGDRNIAANGQNYTNGNYLIPTNQSLSWGKGLHHPGGNMVFSDGRVEQYNARDVMFHLPSSPQTTNWLAFP